MSTKRYWLGQGVSSGVQLGCAHRPDFESDPRGLKRCCSPLLMYRVIFELPPLPDSNYDDEDDGHYSIQIPKIPYGSNSAGQEKWPFNVLFFLKVEPPCDQT